MMIEIIGKPAMLEQFAEEATELAQAALKMARKLREENPTPKTQEECEGNLVEEFTDVIQCARELDLKVDEEQIKAKEQRFKDRMAQKNAEICKTCHQADPSEVQCFDGHIQGNNDCIHHMTTEEYLNKMG